MSMWDTSNSGVPSTIHSAITLPTPPAAASPCTQNPAATQNPRSAVRGERLRTVHHLDDLSVHKGRYPALDRGPRFGEARQVRLEERPRVRQRRNIVRGPPGLRRTQVASDEDPVALAAEVDDVVRV